MKLEKHKKCGRHVLELYPQTEYHCGKIIWDWESTETRCINSPPQCLDAVSSEYTGCLPTGEEIQWLGVGWRSQVGY